MFLLGVSAVNAMVFLWVNVATGLEAHTSTCSWGSGQQGAVYPTGGSSVLEPKEVPKYLQP